MTMKRILLLFLLFCGGYVHAQELDSVRIYYRQGHREVDVLFTLDHSTYLTRLTDTRLPVRSGSRVNDTHPSN